MSPILDRRPVKLCYVRPEHFVELDPLAAALTFLAREVSIVPKIPNPDVLSRFDAMVAVALRPGAVPLIPADLHGLGTMIGKPAFPVLGIVASGEAPPSVGPVIYSECPLSLDRIHRWMSSISR
jgi:hypothetical protein